MRSTVGARRILIAASASASLLLAATGPTVLAASISIKDSGHLSESGSEENTIRERGSMSGSLPGSVSAALTITGKTARANFTIYTKQGTISGYGSGTLKPGKDGYDSFGGSLQVTGGSGHYRGAKGTGAIYGSIDRLNEKMSVQVDGTLHS